MTQAWRALVEKYRSAKDVTVAQVDCSKYPSICNDQRVAGYPQVFLYKQRRKVRGREVERGRKTDRGTQTHRRTDTHRHTQTQTHTHTHTHTHTNRWPCLRGGGRLKKWMRLCSALCRRLQPPRHQRKCHVKNCSHTQPKHFTTHSIIARFDPCKERGIGRGISAQYFESE